MLCPGILQCDPHGNGEAAFLRSDLFSVYAPQMISLFMIVSLIASSRWLLGGQSYGGLRWSTESRH